MLKADSDSELLSVLADIDISVPGSKSRTAKYKEQHAIAYLLSTLLGKDRISYPLNLIKREGPDFLLTSNGVQIGIEHTEAVPENEAHKDALRKKGNGPDAYFIQLHHPGERKKSKKELTAEIKANPLGDGWRGDKPEREWAGAIIHFIDKKVKSMHKDGFERFEQNWLLIYDNWIPRPNLYKAVSFLQERVIEQKALCKFERLYVLNDRYLCEFNCELNHVPIEIFDINDLWV